MRRITPLLAAALLVLGACTGDNPAGPDHGGQRLLAAAPAALHAGGEDGCGAEFALSASSTCVRLGCGPVGPGTYCEQLIYDSLFDDYCPRWVANTYATRGSTSATGAYFDLWSRGAAILYQRVDVTPYTFTTMDMQVKLEVINRASAGTEKLVIEIRDAATNSLLQIAAYNLTPANITADGVYYYDLMNFSGREIKLQFRVIPGSAPGNTYFRIHDTHMWGS
jgi:hypothetical protein